MKTIPMIRPDQSPIRLTALAAALLLSIVLNATAPGHPENTGNELTFTTTGLQNETLFKYIFTGDFINIPFDRDAIMFSVLLSSYVKTYGTHCDKNLPQDKIELTVQECDMEEVTRNGYGVETDRRCIRWRTVRTGIYASPVMFETKMEIERIQSADAFRNVWKMMTDDNSIEKSFGMYAEANIILADLEALFKMNACDSPGMQRFEDNLRLFAYNKQGIRLDGSTADVKTLSADQDYDRLIEDLVFQQSQSWAMNRYQKGSISVVAVLEREPDGRPSKMKANYIYEGWSGRSKGSVTLTFDNGLPECLYFFDMPTTCRSANRKTVDNYRNGAYQK